MPGDLSETSAADVCRDLAARAVTGTLTVAGPTGSGTVAFADGRITGAASPRRRARIGDRLVGAGLLDDEVLSETLAAQAEARSTDRLGALLVERGHVSEDVVRSYVQDQVLDDLFEILRWQAGPFEFAEGPPDEDTGVPLSVGVDDALVEVARRRVEWDQLSQVIPDLDAIPTFRQGAGSASTGLEPDEFAVLASVDGSRSVRELADDLGYGEFEAARIVYSLTLLGVLDIQPAPPKPHVVADEEPAGDAEPVADAERAEEPAPAKRSGDVAEFMRELSRLAGDDASKAKTSKTAQGGGEERAPDTGVAPTEDQAKKGGKKKRRGLFGRGG